jgi:hypothetical protein
MSEGTVTYNHLDENKSFGRKWMVDTEMVLLESAYLFSIDRYIDLHWSFISSEQDG